MMSKKEDEGRISMKNKQAPPTPAHTGRGLQGFKGGKGWFFRGAKLYIRYIPLYAI